MGEKEDEDLGDSTSPTDHANQPGTVDRILSLDLNRREWMLILAGGISVVVLSEGNSEDSEISGEVETALTQIATEVDQADLSQPYGGIDVWNTITEELSTARSAVENEDMSQETREEVINPVIEYYSSLRSFIDFSLEVHDNLTTVELSFVEGNISEDVEGLEQDYLNSAFDAFEEATENIPSDGQLVNRITPDLDATLTEARQLQARYKTYADLQKKAITAQTNLFEGANKRERSQAQEAATRFTRAESASTDRNVGHNSFELTEEGLSVADYLSLLSSYESAAQDMRESCENLQDASYYSLFERGLSHLFDSRKILESTY